jgi:acetolactate synthase-1/2/3 large subunit
MADAYARVSFKPGVCDATVGPGTTNLVTGVAEAYGNSIPLVVITSDVLSSLAGRGVSQECDQLAVLRQFTKASFRIDQTEKIPETVRRAFRISVTGRPGPVHLDIPEDVLQGRSEFAKELYADPDCKSYPARRVAPESTRVTEAIRLVVDSNRPVILAGGGGLLSQAWDEVTELSELLGAPVATTITGKGAIPENHSLSVGTVGRQGYREPADRAVEESDVLIAVGCKFAQVATDNWTLINPATKIIHIDIDPVEIGRIYPVAVAMASDAKLALRALIDGLSSYSSKSRSKRSEWVQRISVSKKEWLNSIAATTTSDSMPIKPERLVKEIRDALPDDSIFVSDTSFTGAFTACYFDVRKAGRTYLQHRGMAGIGNGLPATIGAKCAAGDRVVIGMGGDGGFAYHISELETAKRHGIQIVYAVSNNNSLGWIKYIQEKHYSNRVISTEYGPIDFAKVAEGYGCFGKLVEKPSDIQPSIRDALKSGLPGVLNVQVDPTAVPPIGRKTSYAVAQ